MSLFTDRLPADHPPYPADHIPRVIVVIGSILLLIDNPSISFLALLYGFGLISKIDRRDRRFRGRVASLFTELPIGVWMYLSGTLVYVCSSDGGRGGKLLLIRRGFGHDRGSVRRVLQAAVLEAHGRPGHM